MTTAAKPRSSEASHYYYPSGQPCYEVPYADPRKGMRPTSLADARKLGLLPSVTTILRVLDKPALTAWLIEQACLAVLTSPRNPNEELDAFVERILHTERVQDQEVTIARDRGTEIHAAMEAAWANLPYDPELLPWIQSAHNAIAAYGKTVAVEKIVVGLGYAGRVDLIQEGNELWIWDYKSTSKLPTRGAWPEHALQAAGYAAALGNIGDKRIRTGNVYISTVEQGKFVVCEHGDWTETYEEGFKPLVQVWQHLNHYKP